MYSAHLAASAFGPTGMLTWVLLDAYSSRQGEWAELLRETVGTGARCAMEGLLCAGAADADDADNNKHLGRQLDGYTDSYGRCWREC